MLYQYKLLYYKNLQTSASRLYIYIAEDNHDIRELEAEGGAFCLRGGSTSKGGAPVFTSRL